MADGHITVQRTLSRTHGISDEEHVIGEHAQRQGELRVPSEKGSRSRSATASFIFQKQTALQKFWYRFQGKGRRRVGYLESLKNMIFSSWLNVLLILIPFAWTSHFIRNKEDNWGPVATFVLCFFALIPLEQLFDWAGEQMSLFLGTDLGDLLIISINNSVEATLAIILLTKCELKILQSTIIGVILLHLLLVPGMSFLTHGARIWEQDLHPHNTELNHSLLTIGCMTLIVPAAFFAALDRGTNAELGSAGTLVTDSVRGEFLKMSRGIAIILLVVYISSRVFLHDPPGEDNALQVHPDAPEEIKIHERQLLLAEPETNPWACIMLLVVGVGIMAYTAEMLVESIEFVRKQGDLKAEWFGLVLLPIVSFAADGAIAIGYFCSVVLKLLGGKFVPTTTLAKARSIDLSIQFVLFWMPFVVILGWWTGKPMTLLFDFFEVAILLGSCFLVNYVTADKKTNWVEGLIMVSFYVTIVICAWFYPGQREIDDMHACLETVAEAVANGLNSTESE
jgi:Ca2+:H+ antiporter